VLDALDVRGARGARGGLGEATMGDGEREPPQQRGDLLRLVAAIEAMAVDPAKAPVCRELLAKLRPYVMGPPAGRRFIWARLAALALAALTALSALATVAALVASHR
jgi:hypothetical protein